MINMSRWSILPLCLVCSLAAFADGNTDVEFLADSASATQKLPFSEAVRAGNLLFLSGQIGLVPGTMELTPGGIQPETRQTLQNIKATLEKYDSSMSRVIKCTVFLADIAEWAAMNEVYLEFFPDQLPARSALGTSGLALGARTEIECIAALSP